MFLLLVCTLQVIQLAEGVTQPQNNVSPPRGRGRGRGHGFPVVPSPVGGPSFDVPPQARNIASNSSARAGLGRGRLVLMGMEPQTSEEMAQEVEGEKEVALKKQELERADREAEEAMLRKKRERKLKKMLRQVRVVLSKL